MADVKFIRVHGRVVPVKKDGGAGYKSSKRYGAGGKQPAVKHVSKGTAGVVGVGTALLAKKAGFGLAASALGGLAVAALTRSVKKTSRAKGETNQQAARRVALGNKAYNSSLKKGRK